VNLDTLLALESRAFYINYHGPFMTAPGAYLRRDTGLPDESTSQRAESCIDIEHRYVEFILLEVALHAPTKGSSILRSSKQASRVGVAKWMLQPFADGCGIVVFFTCRRQAQMQPQWSLTVTTNFFPPE